MRKRAERRWTIMLVPHGSGSSRAVELSHTVVKSLMGIGGVVVLVMVVLGVAAIARGVNIARNGVLEHETRVLVDELQRLGGRPGAPSQYPGALGGPGLRFPVESSGALRRHAFDHAHPRLDLEPVRARTVRPDRPYRPPAPGHRRCRLNGHGDRGARGGRGGE